MKFILRKSKEILHEFFQISVLLKGLHGAVELLGGFLVLAISGQAFEHMIAFLTEGEFFEDRNDFLTNMLVGGIEHLAAGRTFAILYLLSHGLINLLLAVGLWKKQLWSYHAALLALTTFTAYQLYRLSIHYSHWMLFLTVFDLVLIGLTYYEYSENKKARIWSSA